MRALWVVASPFALHTDHMTRTTVTTFIRNAVAFVATAFGNVVPHAAVIPPKDTGQERQMKRFAPTLLLAFPLVVALVPEAIDSTRTIDVTVSRYAFAPERIEVHAGTPIRLNIVSVDGTHGFQVKALGLNASIPAGGRTVVVELTPTAVGTFEITCSEYCGRGHSRMKASFIVTPAR